MAFGQASGPPASARELAELLTLIEAAGFDSFKEARHQLGLTQRQAGGKFTRDEVTELVARLTDAQADTVPEDREAAHDDRVARREQEQRAELLATLPAEELARELERRSWICIPPT